MTNIISWLAWVLTIVGIAGMGTAMCLTNMDTRGVVQEPWGIIGPSIYLFIAGVTGMLVTKVVLAILSRKKKQNKQER
ncbi:hypothetical protein DUT91_23865 [Phyllobacterium salinisoli]|uniref:DUF3955 domain-containing protein n=1 Tax=Phyllobacterium salinisoli TaxID=1899321 RepID=A0A368K0I5_9HYPH|nr:hypothetical protein [Phyllobacterium salinisoli]RCS21480.1 hypothetical protein DUT91_23865 [Phyllobacterium salinisoli]